MNYNETKETLKENLWARIPLITFFSMERNRSIELIKSTILGMNYELYIFTMTGGMINAKDNSMVNSDKTMLSTLEFISKDLDGKSNMTYLITESNDFLSSSVISRYFLDLISKCESKSSTIIVLSEENLWDVLSKYGVDMELSLPTEDEIIEIVKKTINPYSGEIRLEWDEENFKEIGSILSGLSEMEIRNVISLLLTKKEITKNDIVELNYAKDSMFNNINGLEKITVDKDLTFAGLENLREWLVQKEALLKPQKKEEMLARGMKPPRGILMVGVPGCGKSLCAKVTSLLWKLPLYRLDLATVQGMYVGQSEAQLKAAFDAADHVSPCILWIDEIEKGLSGVSDSNVTIKLVGQFLYWLQESNKPVFVVATANDVSKLPSELLRKGRFDELFFVDMPNEEERKLLVDLYSQKYLQVRLSDAFLMNIVNITVGFSSSDIEYILRDIGYKQISVPNFVISEQVLLDAFSKAISISKQNPESIAKIQEWGKARAVPASKRSKDL